MISLPIILAFPGYRTCTRVIDYSVRISNKEREKRGRSTTTRRIIFIIIVFDHERRHLDSEGSHEMANKFSDVDLQVRTVKSHLYMIYADQITTRSVDLPLKKMWSFWMERGS